MDVNGKEYTLSSGMYGKIIAVGKTLVRKEFKDWKIFLSELFYLALVSRVPNFCQLDTAGPKWITMKRYQYDLHLLSNQLSYQRRALVTNQIIRQMISAITFLHQRGISHNDINIKNIFCDYNSTENANSIKCYLGDFSISLMSDLSINFSKDTIYYDVYEKCDNKEKDIYSLGATIVHFLVKKCSCDELNYKRGWKYRDVFPEYYIHDFTSIFLDMALSNNRRAHEKITDIELGNKILVKCKNKTLQENIMFVGLVKDFTRILKDRDSIYYCTYDELRILFSYYGKEIVEWLLLALEEYKHVVKK